MKLQFSHLLLFIGGLFILIIYGLSFSGNFIKPANEVYLRFILRGIFFVSLIYIAFLTFKDKKKNQDNNLKFSNLIAYILPFLLVSTIFSRIIGAVATGIFIVFTLIFFIINKKIYTFNKVYIFLFVYALLMVAGTITTDHGLRIPDKTWSFFLLPIAYTLFRLHRKVLLDILHIFFRGALIYMTICIIYWWFNFLYLDVAFIKWVSGKMAFECQGLVGWKEQLELTKGYTYFSAYYFVNSWAYYFHPSYTSLVLLFGLISGFYLYYKKNEYLTVTKLDLLLYNIFCFLIIALLESRIGLVGYIFILTASSLYYVKLKTNRFLITLLLFIAAFCSLMFVIDNKVENFMEDNIRKTDSTLAIGYIKDHFWWGAGFEEQHTALQQEEKVMKDVLQPAGNEKTYTHNQFLGNMVQFGIWGLIVLLIMLFGIGWYAIKSRSYLLQMFTMILILFMTIEEPLYGQKGITIFTVFLTFFIAISESKLSSPVNQPKAGAF